ncbi:alpha/beta fold hydrolase [Pseudoduganella umbonata]|uniref:Alpha/beta hydrolase n=1 Tax=Pseudoduganella umbonata TaxID=864828 RepID=A0A4V1ECY8_9BURK|nr:alpha/beta fold hydrolase [Pseudoduganella umbonata]MBB3224953.1 pimeloyl-ACP methyl ester carboxylesterase [Pseudoduganella umbonata]QCP09231.1 alpha/beta hydrolase [Pseudoduganella umbonata]
MLQTRRVISLLLLPLAIGLEGCGGDDGDQGVPGEQGAPGAPGANADAIATIGEGAIIIDGAAPGDPKESIYVRKAGHGPKVIVLVPGNNTSGATFDGMMGFFRSVDALNDAYTVYAFDYRGSGKSSYNTKITSLKDFAADFEKVMNKIANLPASGVTLVGYSMGFGAALEMVIANPGRYANVVSLAGIGTRGVRVGFNAGQAGTDSTGHAWANGDWVTVANDAAGIAGTGFQQRSWQGDQRTYANVQATWDAVVYNDVLKYDISKAFTPAAVTDPTFRASPNYNGSLLDGFTIQYMPESLYYSHKFNVSPVDVVKPAPNADGTVVTIPGDGRLGALFNGKRAMLVKATTDFAAWRGDQVIYDNYTATSKYDLKRAGADVTAVMINPNQGFDHGFPVARPLETVRLIDAFIKGDVSAPGATSALGGAGVAVYPNGETAWETDTFTGF